MQRLLASKKALGGIHPFERNLPTCDDCADAVAKHVYEIL
jgi:hypothetical protein